MGDSNIPTSTLMQVLLGNGKRCDMCRYTWASIHVNYPDGVTVSWCHDCMPNDVVKRRVSWWRRAFRWLKLLQEDNY